MEANLRHVSYVVDARHARLKICFIFTQPLFKVIGHRQPRCGTFVASIQPARETTVQNTYNANVWLGRQVQSQWPVSPLVTSWFPSPGLIPLRGQEKGAVQLGLRSPWISPCRQFLLPTPFSNGAPTRITIVVVLAGEGLLLVGGSSRRDQGSTYFSGSGVISTSTKQDLPLTTFFEVDSFLCPFICGTTTP